MAASTKAEYMHTVCSRNSIPCYKLIRNVNICSVQFSSVAQSCSTLCDPMNHSTPGLPVHHQLPEFTQIHGHLILCRPLLLPPIFPNIRVFSNESALRIRWPIILVNDCFGLSFTLCFRYAFAIYLIYK